MMTILSMDFISLFFVLTTLFMFGLAIGSFLNVVIYRTLNDESPLEGRSRCPHCKHQIRWFDNIPLLSFIILKGRCRDCKKSISWMYPLVELTTGLLFVWWFMIGFSLYFQLTQEPFGLIQKAFWLVIAILFIIIFFTDLISSLIPDYAVYGVFVLGLLYRISLGVAGIMRWQDVGLTLLGSLIVTVFFLFLWWITKRKGMGFGDVQLVAGLAILVGWPHVFLMTFLGFLYGASIATVMLFFRRKTLKHTLPFGPFLILATITTLVWGDKLLHWYLQML